MVYIVISHADLEITVLDLLHSTLKKYFNENN